MTATDRDDRTLATSAAPGRGGWLSAIETTVSGLGYDLVDVERLPRGLLRVSIDRVPGHAYPGSASEFVTVEDCEAVTRQLQYLLEVEQFDYARLEVSSPGLDRPLRKPADWVRFTGEQVEVTLRMPFEGRKKYQGVLHAAEPGWRLVFTEGKQDKALDFQIEEVREARLVPVVDFKGRRLRGGANEPAAGAAQGQAEAGQAGADSHPPTGERKR